jgi:uncharacterized protein (DUF342 family)
MPQEYQEQTYYDSARTRDLEEKVRVLKDRILLIGKTLLEEKEKNNKEIRDMKAMLIKMKSDTDRMKEVLERISEQLTNTPKKEELSILQRQLDLLRK